MKLKKDEALVLRTCKADMTAHGGFVWPKEGEVKAPDWKPEATCGNGLHGLLWGEGDGGSMCWDADAVWMVLKVKVSECVDLGRKVKFPSCEVVYSGERDKATQLIALVNPKAVIEGLIQAGGNYATMMGGNYATMMGGHFAKMMVGDFATMTGGHSATMTGGYYATMMGGHSATMTGGDFATMTGGHSATMTGGDFAVLQFSWWDGKRTRVVIAYVGENGVEANKPYRLDSKGNVVEVSHD